MVLFVSLACSVLGVEAYFGFASCGLLSCGSGSCVDSLDLVLHVGSIDFIDNVSSFNLFNWLLFWEQNLSPALNKEVVFDRVAFFKYGRN